MEVRPGYKRTEVGVIPKEWEVLRLDGCMNLLTDFEANGSFEHVAQNVRVYDVEHFAWYVRATDLENDTPLSNVRYVDRASYAYLKKTSLAGNEVLITKRGEIGKVYLFQPKTAFATLAPNLYLLKLDDTVLPAYVFAFFKYGLGQRALKNINASTTLGALYKNDVKAISMPRPPLAEQRAIAAALRDVDALLGGLDRLIAKKRDLKQAAMQQLLTGQTRLPGFNGQWEVKTLEEVASIAKGTQLHSSETNAEGDVPHFNGGISPSSYTDKANTPANTIAISEGGNSCGYVQFISEPFWCGGHCYAVVPKDVDKRFLYHALKGQQSAIMGLRVGSGLPNVQKTALVVFSLSVPSDPLEQAAIASVLSDMDAELAALEARLDKTRDLKQAMMQELLTGKTRLVNPEAAHA